MQAVLCEHCLAQAPEVVMGRCAVSSSLWLMTGSEVKGYNAYA